MDELQDHIEKRIGEFDPEIELIALERPGREVLRLYIDHPEGVGLQLCERVTEQLRELLAEYSLEVSSPGVDRPLTKPEHFQRFSGRRIHVRTSEPIEGRRKFTGLLAGAGESSLTLTDDAGSATEISFGHIRRSNLVPELSEVTP